MVEKTVLEEREYQTKVLKFLREKFAEGKNVIVELDCGLGKRVLTYLLVQHEFPGLKFLVLLHSASSLLETSHYLKNNYGGVNGMEYLSSRTPPRLRLEAFQKARVVLSTPQVTLNILKKQEAAGNFFDVVLINEVDKLVLRQAHKTSLTFPWNKLLPIFFRWKAWIVGMSGTLRDTHIAKKGDDYGITPELKTIMQTIPKSTTLSMSDLVKNTDVEKYIQEIVIRTWGVKDDAVSAIMDELDNLIEETKKQILNEAFETDPGAVKGKPWREVARLVSYLPISTDLKERYNALTMIRKYVTAMTPWVYRRYLSKKIGIKKEVFKNLPKTSSKIRAIPEIIGEYRAEKTVILTSYVNTAKTIAKYLEKLGYEAFLLTGRVFDKQSLLEGFRRTGNRAVIVMSPIGERDIDLPEAELLVMHDIIRTPKTVYQRLKRIRGGNVVIIFYEDTSEARKIEEVVKTISRRYSWSVRSVI